MEGALFSLKHKKSPAILLVVVLLLLALIGAGAFLLSRYTWAAGAFRAKNSESLDLRGEELTTQDYQELTRKLPNCEILWDVPFQGFRVSSDAQAVTINQLSGQDIGMLEYLPRLTQLTVISCRDHAALMDFAAGHPQLHVSCPVPIGDENFPQDSTEMTVADADVPELERTLHFFDKLAKVTLTGTIPEQPELDDLIATFPDIFFLWQVPVGNITVGSDAVELDPGAQKLGYEEISRLLPYFPKLEQVNLLGCPLRDEQVVKLAKDYPGCRFLWELELNGQKYRTDAQELDLSGWQITSPQQIEDLLPCFFNLERVILSDCGLDDETMDALNRRYENIRFIWTVYIKNVPIRTDATWFYPFKYQKDLVVEEQDLYPLRYCTDMVCIDIGHMFGVKTCDWAAFMPDLEYLILGETGVTDLTPLSGLKKLKFLELFTLEVTDFTPLLGCTGLEDLNLGLTYGDPEVIAQMTWLKNLWWCDANGYANPARREAVERMCQALADTKIAIYIDHPTAGGWRQLPNYFAMRDYLGMFYLP